MQNPSSLEIKLALIVDNLTELFATASKNKNQMDLFANTEFEEIKLQQKTVMSYMQILEEERKKLGSILSVDYLEGTNFYELLGNIPTSLMPLSEGIYTIRGICIEKKEMISSRAKRYYIISFGDSQRKIDIYLYDDIIYN